MIYDKIILSQSKNKLFAVLIDPDKYDTVSLKELVVALNKGTVDFILIGGSLVSDYLHDVICYIKSNCDIPVILFPGSLLQISPHADAILLLSLVSGRNPDLLIGNHVVAAPVLKKSTLEIIPTGYIMVENGKTSSAEYISNTKPIPADKPSLAVATAIASEMLGHKLIYLEGGSGASHPISPGMIEKVKENIKIPLVVGGGIKSVKDMIALYDAGADMIVAGNVFEGNPKKLIEFSGAKF